MIHLSTCPRCARMVLLPENAEAAAVVRCPLCHAEYPLGEALALVPPALIVVPPVVQPAIVAAPVATATQPFFFEGPTIPVPAAEDDFAVGAIHQAASETSATVREEAPVEAFLERSAEILAEIPAEVPAEIPFETPADAFIAETEEAEKEASATESPDDFTFDFTEHAAEVPSVDKSADEPAELPVAASTAAAVSVGATVAACRRRVAVQLPPQPLRSRKSPRRKSRLPKPRCRNDPRSRRAPGRS